MPEDSFEVHFLNGLQQNTPALSSYRFVALLRLLCCSQRSIIVASSIEVKEDCFSA